MHARLLVVLFPIALACRPSGATRRPTSTPPPLALETLAAGAQVRGFHATALFLDDAERPIGARFVHAGTKFTLDYLRVETAPQGFLWVNSFPTSDQGEPHTQEHLLLGKGDRGRKLGSSEAMTRAESSAFTDQWRTAYHFHTVAGHDVFWPVLETHLEALLKPDYTDEEIRREVRNFGIAKGDDGALRLEEKGTVYNEMVRSYENPSRVAWEVVGQLVYGPRHPLAMSSGGHPDAIRTMTPEHIRTFHRDNYHLANMGMIAAFPASMTLETVLDRTRAILERDGWPPTRVAASEAALPEPAGAPAGRIEVVEYPYSSATNPGPMTLAWPATRRLDDTERTLLSLFLAAFAGDESTTLYKKLIDGKSRVLDLGANAVWAHVEDDQGQPVMLGVSGVKADKLDAATVGDVRALVRAELERIATLPDGAPELAAFRERVESRVIELQRQLNKFLDSPPGFGIRGTGSGWMDHLHALTRSPGFKKSVTMRPVLAEVRRLLAAPGNPWRGRVRAWGLLEVPYGVAVKPSPARRAQLDAERKQRIADELARLQASYGTKDASATLARYQQDYDAETSKLERAAKTAELPPLVESLPLTLDDGLHYEVGKLAGVPAFMATFDSMASTRVELSFDLRGAIAPDAALFVSALPALLADAGVIINGTPVAADEMRERIREEILELSIAFDKSDRTGRLELVVAGAGNGATETRAALAWMRHVMLTPDWRIENLPRLRDVIDQKLTALHARMLGAEELWVDDPRDTWRHQSPLRARAASFLTQMHDLHRLRWMLLDPRDVTVTDEVTQFLALLGEARLPRARLLELARVLGKLGDPAAPPPPAATARWSTAARKLSPGAKPLAIAAGKDLAQLVSDLPDNSLVADWKYLTRQMSADLRRGAPYALAKLAEVRANVVVAARARLVEVGSRRNRAATAGALETLVRTLPMTPRGVTSQADTGKPFAARLGERDRSATHPVFVGLVASGTSSGVLNHLAPATWYGAIDDDAVLDYLTSNLYTGHGGHSMFMKTWAAGLAYSNGLRPQIADGALQYYAERTPLLPQTLRFVIEQLRGARPDPSIARYAVANAFSSRVASGYEARATAMAADLVDGQPPAVVKAFRKRVLELARQPDLPAQLFARMETVYSKVLPGYGPLDPTATYFVIGPEKQLAAHEDYLRATFGEQTKLFRLYPRDFWIPAGP